MRIALAIALSLALAPAARAEEGGGKVDWEHKVVKCTGSGAANLKDADGNAAVARIGAEKAAKLDALRSCLSTLRGVQLESGRTVGGALDSDRALSGKVQGLVKGFRVVGKPRYYSDGGVEIDVEVPIEGALSDALLPRDLKDPPPAPDAIQIVGGPSSLVVDARGLKVLPAIAPKVMDEKGAVVYGPLMLDENARKVGGGAAYAPDLDAARSAFTERVGKRPWLVKAVRVEGADVVISQSDADQFRGTVPQFLKQGKVVILAN
jgi:hypothetical protein